MIFRILDWLNLLDSEKKFSITNAAIYALIIKMLVSPTLDWPSVTAMIVTFVNYMHKRQTVDGAIVADKTDEMAEIKKQYEAAVVAQAKAIADIQAKLGGLSQMADMFKMVRKP